MSHVRRSVKPDLTALSDPVRATPERHNHNDLMSDVLDDCATVQRVQSGVLALRQSGKIGDAEVAAAERWYADYALAEHGAASPALAGSGGGAGCFLDAQLQAIGNYRAVRTGLGEHLDLRLRVYVGEGLSLRKMSAELGIDQKTVCGMLVADLQTLANFYAIWDGARRAGAVVRESV